MKRPSGRVAAVVLATALASCGGRAPAPAVPAPPARTAAPVPGWSAAEVWALQRGLRSALRAPSLAGSGVSVIDARGRPIFARRDFAPYVPASTFKLLVAATALRVLGPAFRFSTTLEALAQPEQGAVRGDLYLVGSGDPTLTRDDLRAGVAAIVRAGVRRVDGTVIADASAFADPELNRAWDPDDLQYGYAAGISALSLDQGTVEFRVDPAAPGAPASIRVLPRSTSVRVLGGIVTASTTQLAIAREPARNDFAFSGRIAAGAEQSFWRPVIGLPHYAADVTRTMLREAGASVTGGVGSGIAPVAPAVLWRHRSAPLREIVRDMLVTSNNHFAEQLLRAVGTVRGTGTAANAVLAERALLRRDGVPQTGLRVIDASGLAATDRVAPITLALLLARTAAQAQGGTFIGALPLVGLEGTVRGHRLTSALGRARAKSGHIADVDALAGYVVSARHGRLSFAVLVNDRRADDRAVDAGIDAMLDILARS
jgi:D-alanyl-D-alanine carboxypeptidase/D-alanyl-D-alanine-endopeptidase (penicillin-binding protein 4)